MRIVGLDPGVGGSIALYDVKAEWQGPAKVFVYDYPTFVVERKTKKLGKQVITKRTHYDIPALVSLIQQLHPDLAVIEEVSARPADGAVQAFSFGKGYGLLMGILSSLRGDDDYQPSCEIVQVRPAVWKKAIGLPTGSTKNDSRLLALKLFPELAEDLKLKKNEGRAEAALLIHYYLNKKK